MCYAHEGSHMSKPRFNLLPRGKEPVKARLTGAEHGKLVDQAFALTFERYENALEELAKR